MNRLVRKCARGVVILEFENFRILEFGKLEILKLRILKFQNVKEVILELKISER